MDLCLDLVKLDSEIPYNLFLAQKWLLCLFCCNTLFHFDLLFLIEAIIELRSMLARKQLLDV